MRRIRKPPRSIVVLVLALAALVSACQNPVGSESSQSGGSGSAQTYTVTYDPNGANTGTAPVDGASYAADELATVLGNTGALARGTDTFAGWNTADDGSGTNYTAGATLSVGNSDVTLYARWVAATVNIYTVTFDSNGGSSVAAQDVVDGETATEPPEPTRSGFQFDGWHTDAGLTTRWSFATDTVTAPTTLYAKWQSTSSQVPGDVPSGLTGAVDGSLYSFLEFEYWGENIPSSYNTDVYLYPDDATILPEVYIWLNDSSDSSAIDAGTYTLDTSGAAGTVEFFSIIGNMDYSAGTVDYAAATINESTYAGGIGVSFSQYDELTSGSVTVSRSGDTYTFQWSFQSADGDTLAGSYTGPIGSGGGSPPEPPTTYSVTYDSNNADGGSVPVDANDYESGETVTVLSNSGNLTRTDYSFDGWNTSTGGTGTAYAPGDSLSISGDLTLYAQWEPVQAPTTYSVTYNGNGNDSGFVPVDDALYASGDTVTVLANTGDLAVDGSVFDSWNTSDDGTGISYSPGDSFEITANTVLYAVWRGYEAGDTGPAGGTIIYDKGSYSSGWRYIEVAPEEFKTDPETGLGIIWGRRGPSDTVDTTSDAIGSGPSNTSAIIASYGDCSPYYVPCPAAKLASDYSHGGFDDWFLPAKDELQIMGDNRDLIPDPEFFDPSWPGYWSSSEDTTVSNPGYSDVWTMHIIGTTAAALLRDKAGSYRVRPIRYF